MKKTIGMRGFTLAEVLITLGIIGVVAAMTMPTLINSTQGAQYKTAFKKSLTVLSQAVVMNIALNDYDLSQVVQGTNATAASAGGTGGPATPAGAATGSQSLWDLFHNRLNIVRETAGSEFNTTTGDPDEWTIVSDTDSADRTSFTAEGTGHGSTNATVFKTALGPTTTSGTTTRKTWPTATTILMMNDGIAFIFDNTQSNCQQADDGIGVASDNYCYGFIDVNGQKAPNRVVQCDTNSRSTDSNVDNVTCTVSNPTDIYPIAMYNQSVIPATPAARAVLYNK